MNDPQAGSNGALLSCEICDEWHCSNEWYLIHLQQKHQQMIGKRPQHLAQEAPFACSHCQNRYWTHEGLERHLVMSHGLVTVELMQKAARKEDGGRCKLCGRRFAFNILQHFVADHQMNLCAAEAPRNEEVEDLSALVARNSLS